MRVLIKIGGAQLEQLGPRHKLCQAIKAAQQQGHEVLVVHDGGSSCFTPEDVMMSHGSYVNSMLVQSLQVCGVAAVGLTGADGATFTAKQINRKDAEIAFTGTLDQVNPTLVETLIKSNHVPVIATVAPLALPTNKPSARSFFNINADHAAGPLGRSFDCNALLFLTDDGGVFDRHGRLMPLITEMDCERMMANGIASNGIQPKLKAAQYAAHENPTAIIKIAPAADDDCVVSALREGTGSRFFARVKHTHKLVARQHG